MTRPRLPSVVPKLALLFALAPLLAACPAIAHDLDLSGGPFGAGYGLPLRDLAALLGFIAIGLWAGLLGSGAVWQLPAIAFIGAFAAGQIGGAGVVLPHADLGLMAGLVLIGVLIVLAIRLPVLSPPVAVALVAVFEGYPTAAAMHGAQLPFWSGFAAGAGLALAGGLGLAVLVSRFPAALGFRIVGAGIAAVGVLMLLDKI